MPLSAYDASAGLFIRGLSNLNTLLRKTQTFAVASGVSEDALLNARLASAQPSLAAPHDLHKYTLAAQVHWAAEGAKLAVARLLGAPLAPTAIQAHSMADLRQHLDATVEHLRELSASDLERGLERVIVVEHRRGSMRFIGSEFLLAFAIPHFFYHVDSAYSILRIQDAPLTMGDLLGNAPG